MSHYVPTVTAADFDEVVLRSPLPVLVDFGAEWCSPCRAMEPIVHALAAEHAGRVRVVMVDADASAAIAARYRVRALPTVITFHGGKEHGRHTGATSKATLLRLLPEPAAG